VYCTVDLDSSDKSSTNSLGYSTAKNIHIYCIKHNKKCTNNLRKGLKKGAQIFSNATVIFSQQRGLMHCNNTLHFSLGYSTAKTLLGALDSLKLKFVKIALDALLLKIYRHPRLHNRLNVKP
jgi:hypothetical protein